MLSESGGYAAGDKRALRRFLLVERHEAMRRTLSQLIERRLNGCVVGEAVCAVEGLRKALESYPDVVIVDLRLGQIDGVELTQNLRALAPNVRVIAYSFTDDCLSVSRFLAAGGHAFASKHEPIPALVEAIELALAGKIRVGFSQPRGDRQGEAEASA